MRKRLLFLVMAIAVGFFTACDDGDEATPDVVACFDYSPSEDITVGDEIAFTSCSENATAYTWNFGDGDISTDENPTHGFDEGGEFAVKLIASNEKSIDTISKTITVDESLTNSLIYSDEIYPLSKGQIIKNVYYDTDTLDVITVFIAAETIDLYYPNGEDINGNGAWVLARIFASEFTEGVYTDKNDGSVVGDLTFSFAGTDGDNEIIDLRGSDNGQIEIIKASNPIEIKIVGNGVTVYYNGNVDFEETNKEL